MQIVRRVSARFSHSWLSTSRCSGKCPSTCLCNWSSRLLPNPRPQGIILLCRNLTLIFFSFISLSKKNNEWDPACDQWQHGLVVTIYTHRIHSPSFHLSTQTRKKKSFVYFFSFFFLSFPVSCVLFLYCRATHSFSLLFFVCVYEKATFLKIS